MENLTRRRAAACYGLGSVMWLRISLIVVLLAGHVHGQAASWYNVSDEIKAPDLDYIVERDITVTPANPPVLQVKITTSVLGSTRKSFRYTDESYNKPITQEECDAFVQILKQTDLAQLRKSDNSTCKHGQVAISGDEHNFNNPIGDPARDSLQASVLGWLDKTVPRRQREVTVHVVEGDSQETRDVSVEKLLEHPAKYNGKRVTITGYFVDEFESSNLSDEKGANVKKSIWLESPSVFARKGEIQWTDEGRVIVDGVFIRGPGGHGDAWDGELQRVTRMVCLDPQPVPLPRNYESSKRR